MTVAGNPNLDNWPVVLSANSFSLNFPISRYFSERIPMSPTSEGSMWILGRLAGSISGAVAPNIGLGSEVGATTISGTKGRPAVELTAGVPETLTLGSEWERVPWLAASSSTPLGLAAAVETSFFGSG